MFEKIYVVTDLGPGDGGKGSIVHALSCKTDANIIIKRGGAQGSHGVHASLGESFNFSQWGCGTLEGVPTFLSEQMVISPVGLENESEALKKLGIFDPFKLLSCDQSCIVATPYHRIASQFEELLLKDKPRGTVGTGIGQAYRMTSNFGGEMTIRAHDLTDRRVIRSKLQRQYDYYFEQYGKITRDAFLLEDFHNYAVNLIRFLHDEDFFNYVIDLFDEIGKKLRLTSFDEVLKGDGTAIVECSHGVLTDAEMGLKPHVSAIRTLPIFANKMLRNAGYDGEIINYAVHRAYEIRHGAGPMPTYDPEFTARMLPGSHKDKNRWQGAVRAGPLDLNLMRYALDVSKEIQFDGLALTWFDQILANDRTWPVCFHYKNRRKGDESITEYLKHAEPLVCNFGIRNPIPVRELFNFVDKVLESFLKIPLKILSAGPTEKNKIYSE
ncbi:adenylosuccinate synthetase [Candidatus Saccharibacteria bacterium]|nr:adenylosuccinate synthetase [Candidatus Saccharibacteria bacterium]